MTKKPRIPSTHHVLSVDEEMTKTIKRLISAGYKFPSEQELADLERQLRDDPSLASRMMSVQMQPSDARQDNKGG